MPSRPEARRRKRPRQTAPAAGFRARMRQTGPQVPRRRTRRGATTAFRSPTTVVSRASVVAREAQTDQPHTPIRHKSMRRLPKLRRQSPRRYPSRAGQRRQATKTSLCALPWAPGNQGLTARSALRTSHQAAYVRTAPSASKRSPNASRVMLPRSSPARVRTATCPASFSRSPMTSRYGTFCRVCSRIL